MKTFTIQIANMVCPRCIHVVKQILTDLDIQYHDVDLGCAVLDGEQNIDLEIVNQRLESLGLGLIREQNEVTVVEIHKAIQAYLEDIRFLRPKYRLSEYISQELAKNYHQLSKIYSQQQEKTIESYYIELRTNKVKKLVKEGKLNLSQIAINVGYSSIYYLSGQFKKYTGKSLSQFKKDWEASLERGIDIKSLADEEGQADQECGCGCENCGCQDQNRVGYSSDQVQRASLMSKESVKRVGVSQGYAEKFGQFRVYVSV